MIVHLDSLPYMRGEVSTPGDKSKSHRAILISALAAGTSRVVGASTGEDVARTIAIAQQLGADIEHNSGDFEVTGPDGGLAASRRALECGNSGTTMRLLCGVLAGVEGTHHLTGDSSLSQRPMDRVARPLSLMGVDVRGSGESVTPPLVVQSSGRPHAISYEVPVPSAQVKSAVLFAGVAGDGPTVVTERVKTRTATEEMLAAAGMSVSVSTDKGGRRIELAPGRPAARTWNVPGDPSQASFFLVAALLHAEGHVTVRHLDSGAERWGYLGVLKRMGAHLTRDESTDHIDVTAIFSDLVGTEVDGSEIPSLDEVPILAVAAAAARGTTHFRNVSELRIKESDRFTATCDLVSQLGARVVVDGDTLAITGLGSATRFLRLHTNGGHDHRMVMAASIAGAVGAGADINGVETVATSFPLFFDQLHMVGT